ncbi:hypothetical protein HPP92_000443 [Vanilla planifolia]|uniref:Uncharacterized protein n=1 Tax=Vanilla planifolia TaxID=51239 RepID=A0A835S5P4_VANPL|nr:hypothetical protein HPP92_000443 [Vanilla planifolia]
MTTISAHEGNGAEDGEAKRRLPSLFLRRVKPCNSPSSARWMFATSSTISDERPQTESY